MRVAAYTHTIEELDLPELLVKADDVRETTLTPGWAIVAEAIAAHEQKMLARLLNASTKPDDIPYLRGLMMGLAAMREAADTIVTLATERERAARQEAASV